LSQRHSECFALSSYSPLNTDLASGFGQPPFDPRMMAALLLHGYL
jgi:hypothetical protein